jgi:hypothetical protein
MASFGPPRPTLPPGEVQAETQRARFRTSLPEYWLGRHITAAAVVAVIAVVWYVAVIEILPGLDRGSAESLRWTELVASGFAAAAVLFVVVRVSVAGLFRGLAPLLAVLMVLALGYAAAFSGQAYVYFTQASDEDDRWLAWWVPWSKILLFAAFAIVIFRFGDNARPVPVGR